MIKIRCKNLPAGSHVEVRSAGRTTVVWLAPALSGAERRAALGGARQAAAAGQTAPLPRIPFALAVCADRVRTTGRAAAEAARVHPIGFVVPAAVIVAAAVLYSFVTSVTIQLGHPPQAAGPRHGGQGAAFPGGAVPPPGHVPAHGGNVGAAAPGAGHRPPAARSGTAGQQSAGSRPLALAGTAPPGTVTGQPPAQGPSPLPSPAPTATASPDCMQLGPLKVCAGLRA